MRSAGALPAEDSWRALRPARFGKFTIVENRQGNKKSRAAGWFRKPSVRALARPVKEAPAQIPVSRDVRGIGAV